MEDLSLLSLKKTQTLIGSLIVVTLLFIITLILPKYQSPIYGATNPLSVSNNKHGIHIISASLDEASAAASLVNFSGGDWGYVTFLIESKDRDVNKWQQFFDKLRELHLIPIVRLATGPVNSYWEVPYEKEYEAWADFLDNLNWPVKNRYVVIYNEPNHGKEWGNFVDPKSYAIILDQTITALKSKNRDFFVLNAGFDASAPQKPPLYMDQLVFMKQMEEAVPGIFNKLDGWVSHSYPNPGFIGSPDGQGRGTIRNWQWELSMLRQFGVTKTLPVFITETGWKHAEGLIFNANLPTPDILSEYYASAFANAWNNSKIVAVTPFLLNYQEAPFDHFSFKKLDSKEYYPFYETIKNLPKTSGQPVQEAKAEIIKGEIYSSLVALESYHIILTLKNTGQSIWGERQKVRLSPKVGGLQLGISSVFLPFGVKVKPGEEYNFEFDIKAPEGGNFTVELNLFRGNREFDNPPFQFTTEVKSPVILKIKSALRWKEIFSGKYLLSIAGPVNRSADLVNLDASGESQELETRYLLPGYNFDFTLQKPFYSPKTINQKVESGINVLDFGILNPDFLQAIISPKEFWNLLPFAN